MSTTVTSDRFSLRGADETRVEVVTPEGVPLVFTIARAGDRMGALVLDALRIAAGITSIWLLAMLASLGAGGPWLEALLLLAFFLLRNGYFVWFELRWRGRTPGKRRLGLRVIDAGGGALRADAIVVRNLTREAELFVPLVLLAEPSLIIESGPGWVRALSALWALAFLILPLLNRQRRRIGDLLAGTIVVRDPRLLLQRDLVATQVEASVRATAAPGAGPHFTPEQLQMYGIYELQVLEELLRDEPTRSDALDVVARKVRAKIGWQGDLQSVGARTFLEEFYGAQRARLEHDLLLGRARERKRTGRLGRDPRRARRRRRDRDTGE